jgi:DNA-binding MarR family transcriptional regulator
VTAPSRNSSANCAQGWQAKADAGFVEQACRAVLEGRRGARILARWCKPFGLSEPEFQVLWRLHSAAGSGTDQSTLAKLLVLSPAQVSTTIERLRARGWIVQQAMPHDRRRRLWQLAVDGRALLERMLAGATELRIASTNPDSASGHSPSGEEAA